MDRSSAADAMGRVVERATADAPDGSAAARCPLCGGANACVRAARGRDAASGPDASSGGGAGEAACWCVARRFPPALLERARRLDGGAACVCRGCVDAAEVRGAAGSGSAERVGGSADSGIGAGDPNRPGSG